MDTIGFAEKVFYLFHRKADVGAALRKRLPGQTAPLRVLDFGGGRGRVAAKLAAGTAARITVADVDRSALKQVPDDPALRPVRIPTRPPYPFAEVSFDRIILVDVFHHLHDGVATLAELVACLRPGGSLLIVEFDRRRVITSLFGFLVRRSGRSCRFWTPAHLERTLRDAGLQVQLDTLDALRFMVEGRRPLPEASDRS